MLVTKLTNVTRVTVVTEEGTVFERYDAFNAGVEIHVQDEGRTLKIFPRQKLSHIHEEWMLDEAPDGRWYCKACGENV